MKFILLINVKMPTIVGILTFMSRINTSYERLKVRNTYFSILVFMNTLYLMLSWVGHEKKLYDLGASICSIKCIQWQNVTNHVNNTKQNRIGSRISGKGVQMYNGVCVGSLC